jgi:carboxypeptidase family protein
MPGVTVEAASPAFIEKVRVGVSDHQGLYRIVDLRPGLYTVTFTRPGFRTFKREGIELTTGFTAIVNGEMNVGTIEETVTATGASPVVDTQNVIGYGSSARPVGRIDSSTKPAITTTSDGHLILRARLEPDGLQP